MAALYAPMSTPARADAPDGVEILGRLPEPPKAKRQAARIVALDSQRRRMYYIWRQVGTSTIRVVEYDLTPRIPRPIRESVAPGFPQSYSKFLTAYDSHRRRLFLLDTATPVIGTTLHRFDLPTFKIDTPWDLSVAAPGFIAKGITYSPQDQRLYLVGEIALNGNFLGQVYDSLFVKPPVGPVTTVVSLNPATGAVDWMRPIPQCLKVLYDPFAGTFIDRSTQRDALYIFCFNGGASAGNTGISSLPGFTGLVRLGISEDATQEQALGFPVDLFPVSGAYVKDTESSRVGLDHKSDRVFVQSVSPVTPGAWTFDGAISAWIGLIAAPDSNDLGLAINESSGHYYIASHLPGGAGSRYLLVSNARMTPPPQGDVFNIPLNSDPIVDAGSKRLFAPLYVSSDETDGWFVLEDNTPDPQDPDPVDYDELTTDVSEGAGTLASYAGTLSGFGTRIFLVGGLGGARSFVGFQESDFNLNEATAAIREIFQSPLPALSPGDRGVYFGRVSSLDVRNSGAAASAQAGAPDSLTEADVENIRNFTKRAGGGEDADGPVAPVAENIVWPYDASTCLDGSGQRLEKSASNAGGESKAECDLAKSTGSASATFAPVTIGPVTVGASSFRATTRRDPVLGTVTESVAIAKGVELVLPGVGGLSIGRVTATARTIAHGRPGTAKVEYARHIQDATVVDAAGKETFACQASCDPEQLAQAVNENLGVKIRMDVPPADRVATARGAFAGVEKTSRDYIGGLAQNNDDSRALPALQLTINNDSAGKSRLMVQLAAIQAYSIYGISLLSDTPIDGGDGGLLPPGSPPLLTDPGTGPAPVALPPVRRVPNARALRGAFLLARPAREAAIVGLLLALIAAAVATAYRRQSLVEQLEDAPS